MKTIAPHALAFALTALCVVGAVVLIALGHTVPQNLYTLAYASLVGGAGLAPGTAALAPLAPTAG